MSNEVAVIETSLGNIEFEFLEDKAPGHVQNFKNLANGDFYHDTIFHRVIPGFMIQGGDPNTKSEDRSSHGMGGPGQGIPPKLSSMMNPMSGGSYPWRVRRTQIALGHSFLWW